MKIHRFEEIIAWKKAQDLAVNIYQAFGASKDFGFRDQICRASVSVSNNIAEGFERSSDADFSRFLYFSIGSCSEIKSMLYLAERLNYITTSEKDVLIEQCNETSKIIRGLLKYLKPKKANL